MKGIPQSCGPAGGTHLSHGHGTHVCNCLHHPCHDVLLLAECCPAQGVGATPRGSPASAEPTVPIVPPLGPSDGVTALHPGDTDLPPTVTSGEGMGKQPESAAGTVVCYHAFVLVAPGCPYPAAWPISAGAWHRGCLVPADRSCGVLCQRCSLLHWSLPAGHPMCLQDQGGSAACTALTRVSRAAHGNGIPCSYRWCKEANSAF